METIDEVDFSILKVIRDAGQPLWKTRVQELLKERRGELPITGIVAVQTVGRRIDNLNNDGMLDTEVIRPDTVDRDLIIAYTLTDRGEKAVKEKRQAYLRNIVRRDIFRDFRDEDVPQEQLLAAIQDEFDLSDGAIETLGERFDSVQLTSILALYYVEIETQDVLTEHERQLVRQVARGEKEPDEAIDELD